MLMLFFGFLRQHNRLNIMQPTRCGDIYEIINNFNEASKIKLIIVHNGC